MRQTIPAFLIVLAFAPRLLFSQLLFDGVETLHVQDSGMLTAGALDLTGHLYLASTVNVKMLPGETGIAGLFPAGDPVLSKYAPDGTLLWRREFPGNVARICDMIVTPDQQLIVTGGYVDSFRLAPGWVLPGDFWNSSFFIARIDEEGQILWIHTDVSDLPEDRIGWTIVASASEVFVSSMHDGIYSSLRRYGFDGTLQAEMVVDIRTISQMSLDEEGRLYAVGTASPGAFFNNMTVPEPDPFTGYVNYIARLDTAFQVQWIRVHKYITFDEHPKGAVFNGRPLLLSNDFEEDQGVAPAYRLKTYSAEGDLLRSDSVRGNALIPDYLHFYMKPFCDQLLLEYLTPEAFAVKSYGADYQDTVLLEGSNGFFYDSYPFICSNAEKAVFGSNFRNAQFSIGTTVLHNDNLPWPRQFALHFSCENTSTGTDAPAEVAGWQLFPNPATSEVYLKNSRTAQPFPVEIELMDVTGKIYRKGRTQVGTGISLEHIPNGMYLLHIQNQHESILLKGIKQ